MQSRQAGFIQCFLNPFDIFLFSFWNLSVFILDIWHACLQSLHQMSQYPIPSEIVIIEKSVPLRPQKGHSPEFLSNKMLLKFCIHFMLYSIFLKYDNKRFQNDKLAFPFLANALVHILCRIFQLLYMALLMDNCSYKLFFVGKRIWEQVDSTNVIIIC